MAAMAVSPNRMPALSIAKVSIADLPLAALLFDRHFRKKRSLRAVKAPSSVLSLGSAMKK